MGITTFLILSSITYLIISAITKVVISNATLWQDSDALAFSLAWPITLPIVIILNIGALTVYSLIKLFEKTDMLMQSLLGDKIYEFAKKRREKKKVPEAKWVRGRWVNK